MRIGTFNVNNVFSRFNLANDTELSPSEDEHRIAVETSFDPNDPTRVRYRTHRGRLVREKPEEEQAKVAARIVATDADVRAVQEVEDIDTLEWFARGDGRRLYRHVVLVEDDDDRLIDAAPRSRNPVGALTSSSHAISAPTDTERVFIRDLLQIGIPNVARSTQRLTLFNTRKKSHYGDWQERHREACAQRNNTRRRQQAEVFARKGLPGDGSDHDPTWVGVAVGRGDHVGVMCRSAPIWRRRCIWTRLPSLFVTER